MASVPVKAVWNSYCQHRRHNGAFELWYDYNSDIFLLNFSKAFDKVDHNILLSKLDKLGIRGKLYDWISAFLTERSQKVFIDGWCSYLIAALSGVKNSKLKNSKLKIFANESKLHRVIKSLLDRILLQQDLGPKSI